MKCVIPYRYDSNHGEELRYAIRSIVMHFKELSEIIVVGDCPIWYTGTHVHADDIPGRKEFSIYSKLIKVQDRVLYTNDDYFALRPFDSNLPNYYDYFCRDMQAMSTDKMYKDLYGACPPYWLNFDLHCPMVIDTRLYDFWEFDRPIKTYYANTVGVAATSYSDLKLRGELEYSEIKRRIKNRPFFSIADNINRGGMPHVLKELYPLPSPYESAT